MAGKIFYRERRKVERGEKKPRFTITAVYDLPLKVVAEHYKKNELEEIAKETGAELVFLDNIKESHTYKEDM